MTGRSRTDAQPAATAVRRPPHIAKPPDVTRRACCFCGHQTRDDDTAGAVKMDLERLDGVVSWSLTAHVACLPPPMQEPDFSTVRAERAKARQREDPAG